MAQREGKHVGVGKAGSRGLELVLGLLSGLEGVSAKGRPVGCVATFIIIGDGCIAALGRGRERGHRLVEAFAHLLQLHAGCGRRDGVDGGGLGTAPDGHFGKACTVGSTIHLYVEIDRLIGIGYHRVDRSCRDGLVCRNTTKHSIEGSQGYFRNIIACHFQFHAVAID